MARTTYLAPGVYVEEVPSAQQPIAGVGTNTVGFIGVVDDFIYRPEPVEDYNPVTAQAIITLRQNKGKLESEAAKAAKAQIESNILRLKDEVQKAAAEVTAVEKRVTDAAPDSPEKARAESALARARTRQEQKEKEQKQLESDLQALLAGSPPGPAAPPAAGAEAAPPKPIPEEELLTRDVIRPYALTKFEVKADPFDTLLCTNFSEYTSRFGSFSADDPNTAGKALHPGHRALTHAVYGFFKNGGTRCFVARIKPGAGSGPGAEAKPNDADIDRALEAMESIDAIAIVAAPGLSEQQYWGKLVDHCEKCEDRFAILDPPADVGTNTELDIKKLSYETPDNVLPQRNKNAAFYFPHIEVIDPATQMQDEDPSRGVPLKYRGRVYVPPSGHIAGIYARTDEQRGVHKAPANTAVLGALDVKYYVGKPKQELLNPQGVNCIRNMNGDINVWGARTIGGDQNGEWKYVSVRRFFLFLRESIDEGTQWVVFEPNDYALWGKIRRNVSAFLTNVWRTGALFGLTPEESFYVKCDAETNPPEVRDVGMVVTEIGVAIVRPAEFVVFRVTQSVGGRTS